MIFGKATETKGDEISPAASSRDLRITGYIAVDTATTEAAANDALIAFVESRGWTFFGSLGEYIVTSATPQATQGAERPEPPLASWPDSVRAILETIYPRSGPEDHDKAVAALVALTQAPPEAAERGESR